MKVVISSSFRKHLLDIIELKDQLEQDGIEVWKPNNTDVIENKENPEFAKFSKEEEKKWIDLEQEKGLFQTINSRVYLLKPLNPHFLN